MGLFHSSSQNHTCPGDIGPFPDPVQIPVVGGLSFHHLSIIISGSCLAFSSMVCFYMIMRHATHFSLPKEQKQIMRIIFMVPIFSLISFLSVAFYDSAIYIKPVEDVYEAIALASFFLLLCEYIQENESERQEFLASSGSMKQHKFATIGAFQFPVMMLLELVITDITQASGSYCSTSNKFYFAKIWVTILNLLSTSIAIFSVLKFYTATKAVTKSKKPLPKLIAFKAIVFINFLQNTIFSFLRSGHDLKPTDHYTYKDLSVGVPSLLLSIEMVFFALVFLYIFRSQPYYFKKGASAVPLGHGGYHGGFLGIKAIFQALNILDIIKGIFSIPLAAKNRNSPPKQKAWATGAEYERIAMQPEPYGHPPRYPQHAAHPQGMPYQQGAGNQQAGVQQDGGYHATTPFNQDAGYHH